MSVYGGSGCLLIPLSIILPRGDCEESALNLECVFVSTVGGLFT